MVRSASPWVRFSHGENARVPTFQDGTTESMEAPICLSSCAHGRMRPPRTRDAFQSILGPRRCSGCILVAGVFHQAVSFEQAASETYSSLLSVNIWGVLLRFYLRGKESLLDLEELNVGSTEARTLWISLLFSMFVACLFYIKRGWRVWG